jgi:hypothetical protein
MSFSFDDGGNVLAAEPLPQPNPGVPRTFGILNIIFGSMLLLGGLCCGGTILSLSAAGAMANQAQVQASVENAWKQQQQQQLDRLQQQLDAAADPQARQRIQREMEAIKQAPAPKVDVAAMYGVKDPGVVVFWSVEVLSGLVLNLVLIVAGIGLLAVAEWARMLSIGLAALKLLRLAALYGYALVQVIPVMARDSGKAFHDLASQAPQQGGNVPTAAEIAENIGQSASVAAAIFVVLAAIYPVLMLLFLTRAPVKASTQGKHTAPFRTDVL